MSAVPVFREIRPGVETMAPGLALPRHRHREGYATVVLDGRFIEASFAGRFSVQPGDVLLHAAFDCHCNEPAQGARHATRGPRILRLPWDEVAREGHFRVDDPEALARLAESDVDAALDGLKRQLRDAAAAPAPHWSERLAVDLADGSFRLDAWCDEAGLAPATLSRGFRRHFGATPREFRLQARARRAWRAIVSTPRALTCIALDAGFADLAHLSRSVAALTGHAPSAWRGPAIKCVQAAAGARC